MFCVVDPDTLPPCGNELHKPLYTVTRGIITCSQKHLSFILLTCSKRNKFKRMLLNEKFSGQPVLTRQIRRVPLTARPMDLIYFLFFAVSHYPYPLRTKKNVTQTLTNPDFFSRISLPHLLLIFNGSIRPFSSQNYGERY